MKSQYEFFYNKSETQKKLIKNIIYFLVSLLFYFLMVQNQQSVLFTQITLAAVPFVFLYFAIKTWKVYINNEPALTVNSQYLIFYKVGIFLQPEIKEFQISEIKTIGTDLKMKGERLISESISLKMFNDEKHSFPFDLIDISLDDLYIKIKELNPDAKLLNIGEFVYDS